MSMLSLNHRSTPATCAIARASARRESPISRDSIIARCSARVCSTASDCVSPRQILARTVLLESD